MAGICNLKLDLKPQTLNIERTEPVVLPHYLTSIAFGFFPSGNYCPYPFGYEKKGPVKIPGLQ
jgi:hypothetical protein